MPFQIMISLKKKLLLFCANNLVYYAQMGCRCVHQVGAFASTAAHARALIKMYYLGLLSCR